MKPRQEPPQPLTVTLDTKLEVSKKTPGLAESESRLEAGQLPKPSGANSGGSLRVSCGPGAAGYRLPGAAGSQARNGLVTACRKALGTA